MVCMERRFENAETLPDLLDILRGNSGERDRYRDYLKGIKATLLSNIQLRITQSPTSTLLKIFNLAMLQEIQPDHSRGITNTSSYCRFLAGLSIANGIDGQGSMYEMNATKDALFELCSKYYDVLFQLMCIEYVFTHEETRDPRMDSIRILQIQSTFETDVKLPLHEQQLISHLMERLMRTSYSSNMIDVRQIFPVISRARDILQHRMNLAIPQVENLVDDSASYAMDAIQNRLQLDLSEITVSDGEREVVQYFTVSHGDRSIECDIPHRYAPVGQYIFYKNKYDKLIPIHLAAAEISVRKRVESDLASSNALLDRYRQFRNEYIEKRAIEELSNLLGCKPDKTNYYIADKNGNIAERDAIWITPHAVYVMEVKDVKPREVSKTGANIVKRSQDIERGIGAANEQAQVVAEQALSGKISLYDSSGNKQTELIIPTSTPIHKILVTGEDYQHNSTDPSIWLHTAANATPWVIDVFSLAQIGRAFVEFGRNLHQYLLWKQHLHGRLHNADELEIIGYYSIYGNIPFPEGMQVQIGSEFADIFDIYYLRDQGLSVENFEYDPVPAIAKMKRSSHEVRVEFGDGTSDSIPVRPSMRNEQGARKVSPKRFKRRKK